jgi:uncharacterized repeat protein (TIGR03803 family)
MWEYATRRIIMKRTKLSGIATLIVLTAQFLHAQTLTVLHSFTGGKDGSHPLAGLTRDASGSLYGTASKGGGTNNGAVFKLKRAGSGWTLSPLYNFAGGADGAYPVARVVFGPNGTLYGTTENGGTTGDCSGGCGTVFNLQPQPTACTAALCPWIETIVQRFTTLAFPASEVTFDSAGNLYGTTYAGGLLAPGGGNGCSGDCGAVYELSPSNGSWTLHLLYSFYGPEYGDGQGPEAGVVFDNSGNLYGDTNIGGDCNFGILYQLRPGGSGWSEHILQQLCSIGGSPASSLIFDGSNTFYGASVGNTPYGLQAPSVFSLTQSGGNWTFASIYTFNQSGGGPAGALFRDSAGNLYGTTGAGGTNPLGQCPSNGCGTIFKLSPSGGGWTYTELYDFTGGNDGSAPTSNVVMDAAGNLYGTATEGGSDGLGTVWEFTP